MEEFDIVRVLNETSGSKLENGWLGMIELSGPYEALVKDFRHEGRSVLIDVQQIVLAPNG